MMIRRKHMGWAAFLLAALILLAILIIPIPDDKQEYSHVLYDRQGNLLAARIASDQQWRFPITEALPDQLSTCIRYYEDEYFYWHPGINPVSGIKALWMNIKEGQIVRGASTLSMQVMRMYRGNRSRNLWQKIIESLGALKLEFLHSKEEIMQIWAGLAPFGGNTVGASTAAWRYFQRDLNNLSLAEYATLAVLPNSPATVHLSRNTSLLEQRRNFLLKKLWKKGVVSERDYKLSIGEEVPQFQSDLPLIGWHMLQFCQKRDREAFEFHSTVDIHVQNRVQAIVDEFSQLYQRDGIQHSAALVIDNKKNEVMAYVGNSTDKKGHSRYVDCIQAPRSYGSLLKPFLYAYALDQGYFLPRELVKDIPTNIQGFSPKNFDRSYRGWVSFDQMVSQSLNVPAVRTLNYVGLESFHAVLKQHLQLEHIDANAHHHGLSLILGGAEASMWELARLYKGLALNQGNESAPFRPIQFLSQDTMYSASHSFAFHPTSVDHSLQAMASVERPIEEQHFVKYGGSSISWKTGTSYGHRDAWAIGTTPEYTVAVWVGNENGEGVYDLTGAQKAAPILFRIFASLPSVSNFPALHAPKYVQACLGTGRLRGPRCNDWAYVPVTKRFHHLRQCHLHEISATRPGVTDTVLSMDPVANYYYQKHYGQLMNGHAKNSASENRPHQLRIIYPTPDRVVFIPKKLDQMTSQVKVAANSSDIHDKLFWYLNGRYHSTTFGLHELDLELPIGPHKLYVVNPSGQEDEVHFEVVKRDDS